MGSKDRQSRNRNDRSSNDRPAQGQPEGEVRNQSAARRVRRVQPRPQDRSESEALPERVVSKSEPVDTNTTINVVCPSSGYSSQVEALVTSITGMQPNEPYRRINHKVGLSSLFDYFSESIYRYIELRSFRPSIPFSIDQLRICFRYVLAARIGQVAQYQLPQRPAEVRYPSVLGPMLAAIGRYVHPTAAYEIVPTIDPASDDFREVLNLDINVETGEIARWRIAKPEFYDAVQSYLLAYGLPENLGLPVDLITDTDELYRLDDDESERLVGSGDFAPSAGNILNRALLQLGSLAMLYGQHRVIYASIATLRSAVDKLARDAFTMDVGLGNR